MDIHEYQAKEILAKFGVGVPQVHLLIVQNKQHIALGSLVAIHGL